VSGLNGHPYVRISGDQTTCMICGQSWDTNDVEPPHCTDPAEAEEKPAPSGAGWKAAVSRLSHSIRSHLRL
jgi:hypothetical protein